ncbi:hypothetical protein EDD53_0372 [Pacificibacter maritimus]|uniref:Uncharacterized protein n=1 Tax=Pacificibacter maritimus TaxID=762213 RepID=A0A3N4UKS4_9RHOB|nr:hypothetical protein [Pacificibacter maritimus]RPE71256.1 hypothetical protein EDD53_0372 [Pacificibacter maritimus]
MANNLIYLGKFNDFEDASGTPGYLEGSYTDVDETSSATPNDGVLGQTFSGGTMAIVDVTAVNVGGGANDTIIGTDDYDTSYYGSVGTYDGGYSYLGESLEYVLPDGTSYGDGDVATHEGGGAAAGGAVAIDSITGYYINLTVENPDGSFTTTPNVLARVIQTDSGDVFVQNYGSDTFDNKVISSIEFVSRIDGPKATYINRSDFSADNTTFVCFGEGTQIATSRGSVDISQL